MQVEVIITDSSGRVQRLKVARKVWLVGRGEDCDLVLGSRSLERHHMRIRAFGEGLEVEDLTEGQGLRMDGEVVTGLIQLEPGQVLVAGVFCFELAGPDAPVCQNEKALDVFSPPRKSVWPWLVGILLLVLALVAVLILLPADQRPEPRPKTPALPPALSEDDLLRKAQVALNELRLDDADKALEAAMSMDPLCRPCRDLRKQMKAERAAAPISRRVRSLLDLGDCAGAKVALGKLPKTSRFRVQLEGAMAACQKARNPKAARAGMDLSQFEPDPDLCRALGYYREGGVDKACRLLRGLKSKAQKKRAHELCRLMRIVQGRYRQGTTELSRGGWRKAADSFTAALEADLELLPKGVESHHRSEMAREMAQTLDVEAKRALSHMRREQARQLWNLCLKFAPEAGACRQGLVYLSKEN